MTELSETELNAIAGGMNLDNYRTSTNVAEQYWVQEGNMWVLYTTRGGGMCLAASFTKPF